MSDIENKILASQVALEKMLKDIKEIDVDCEDRIDKKGIEHYKSMREIVKRRSIEEIMGDEDDF